MSQKTKTTTELSLTKEELQQKNEELEAARSAAEKAENARDIFLANMSHELRTPINTILGLNELILRLSDRGYREQNDGCCLCAEWITDRE